MAMGLVSGARSRGHTHAQNQSILPSVKESPFDHMQSLSHANQAIIPSHVKSLVDTRYIGFLGGLAD